jgi:abortive infection bacteriophage resistance protein
MISVKQPTTYEKQVEKLRSRGCVISDESETIQILSRVNYYRLTAYFLPFRKSDSSYIQGTNFKTVYRIYALFVQHHYSKYGGQFPIWVIIELFSFGALSHFYTDLPGSSKKDIARTFYQCHQKELTSWLYCCSVLRNICAHFGRLYFRKFPVIPNGIPALDQTNNRSLFGAIMAIRSLYTDTVKWNKEIFASIKNLFAEYSADIQLKHIGFPADWEAKLTR